jgi:chitin deacetylase
MLPPAWVDALNAAVAAGKIPNIPQSTNTPGVNPVYPAGTNPNDPNVCSSTYKCRDPTDLWDAPTGYFGTGFDDGPQPVGSIFSFILPV